MSFFKVLDMPLIRICTKLLIASFLGLVPLHCDNVLSNPINKQTAPTNVTSSADKAVKQLVFVLPSLVPGWPQEGDLSHRQSGSVLWTGRHTAEVSCIPSTDVWFTLPDNDVRTFKGADSAHQIQFFGVGEALFRMRKQLCKFWFCGCRGRCAKLGTSMTSQRLLPIGGAEDYNTEKLLLDGVWIWL